MDQGRIQGREGAGAAPTNAQNFRGVKLIHVVVKCPASVTPALKMCQSWFCRGVGGLFCSSPIFSAEKRTSEDVKTFFFLLYTGICSAKHVGSQKNSAISFSRFWHPH